MTTTMATTPVRSDDDYNSFRREMQNRLTAIDPMTVFTTDATGLFDAYLSGFEEGETRQYHTCHSCRRFFERYGGLVIISRSGETYPLVWDEQVPEYYKASVEAVAKKVRKAKVTGVFYESTSVWGTPVTGEWTHLYVRPTKNLIYRGGALTPFQASAAKTEAFRTVRTALNEWSYEHIKTAVAILENNLMERSEKVVSAATWLMVLKGSYDETKDQTLRANILWKAVSEAPEGFCHPRSSMLGTLLDDISRGLTFETMKRKFDAKMDGLKYQRPVAAPSEGNIRQAEKLIETLGYAKSLERRFAHLNDLDRFWLPSPAATPVKKKGVFSDLLPSDKPQVQMALPAVKMTWVKFRDTILPNIRTMKYRVPVDNRMYSALVTALHDDAPLLFQWDNPVSWYVYHGGSRPSNWNLSAGEYRNVVALTYQPNMWGEHPTTHHGEGVFFLMENMYDKKAETSGAALFPEIMKGELHPVRATIEAYSKKAVIAGHGQPHAAGLMLSKGSAMMHTFTTTSFDGVVVDYTIDRWD